MAKDKEAAFGFFRYNLYFYNKDGIFRQFLGEKKDYQAHRIYVKTPIDFIKDRRVWFVFSRMDPLAQKFVLWKLDRQAKKITGIVRQGAAAYLYDFGS